MEALMLEFATEVAALKRAVQLRGEGGVLNHIDGSALLQELDEALGQLEQRADDFTAFCDEEEGALVAGEQLVARSEAHAERLAYNLDNLPERLPAPAPTAEEVKAPLRPANSKPKGRAKSAKSAKKSEKRAAVPAIPYIRAEEFNSVPKYILGRLSQDDLNKVVDALHEAMTAKYKILAAPRATLSDASLTMWTRFKEQETTATDNHFFITDEDLRKLTANCRPDRSTKSALTALRSLNRIKEIRDGGMLRYAISA